MVDLKVRRNSMNGIIVLGMQSPALPIIIFAGKCLTLKTGFGKGLRTLKQDLEGLRLVRQSRPRNGFGFNKSLSSREPRRQPPPLKTLKTRSQGCGCFLTGDLMEEKEEFEDDEEEENDHGGTGLGGERL